MKIILMKLGLIRPASRAKAIENHMLPWHPLFYKAVKVHILETSATRGNLTR